MNRIPTALAIALIAASCGGDEGGGSTDDFDWDALFARDSSDVAVDEPDTRFGPPDLSGVDDGATTEGSSFGDSCVDDEVCSTGICLDAPTFPAGYCSLTGCERRDECESGTTCTFLGAYDFCAVDCESDGDCRQDYRCNEQSDGARTCIPSSFVDLRPDGEACTTDSDCRGGTCLAESAGWPGGTCTTLGCRSSQACATNDLDNRCVPEPDASKCLRVCATAADCRRGYGCRAAFGGGGQQICRPEVETPVEVPVDVTYPFDFHCDNPRVEDTVTFSFDIAETTTAWVVVPFAADGRGLTPLELELPDGDVLDFAGEHFFQTLGSYWYGSINPIAVPGAPAYEDQVQAGSHRLSVETDSDQLCWYLLEKSDPGTTVDIDITLVGTPLLTAASAPEDAAMTEVIAQLDAILATADLSVGEVRYFDASEEIADEFRIIRSERDASALAETSVLRGPTDDDALRLNLFFTRAFNFGGVIGISMGIPGAPGLHGSPMSAVVFTSEYLGDSAGNQLTAQLIAHEMGHFLGLFHTTEMDSATFDMLSDTPECSSGFPTACPDLTNLMFPFAGADHTVISAQQARVLHYNPLTKL